MCIRDSHLADGSGSARDEHLIPGRGSQPAGPLLELLARKQFDGTVVVEVSTRKAASRAEREAAPVSYTHLRAHETVLDLVCRLMLEKNKKKTKTKNNNNLNI